MKNTELILLLTLLYGISNAQSLNDQPELQGWNLPSLQTLIDSAVINATTVKLADAAILASQYEDQALRRDWMERVNLTATGMYGNAYDYARALSNSQGAYVIPSENRNTWNYGGGVSVLYPLSQIFDRKRLKQQSLLRIEQAEIQKEGMEQVVKQQVITAYYNLRTVLKQMEIEAETLALLTVSYDQAKILYSDNRITLSEYTQMYQTYIASKNMLEVQKNAVMSAFRSMEVLTGIQLLKP
jgi:outer membrane protein TolC